MTTEKIVLSSNPTQEQIDEAKKQVKARYGESAQIFEYAVDGLKCFVRTVDRDTYSAAAAQVSKSPAKFNDVVITNIWLGGDEQLRKDDRYYFGLIDYVEEMMAKKKRQLDDVINNTKGTFEANGIDYINGQLRYHFKMSKQELSEMTDEEWAKWYAILTDIRKKEAEQMPFAR